MYTLFTSHSSRQLHKENDEYAKMRNCYSNECVMTKAKARVDHVLTEKIGSNLTSFHTLTFYLFITDHIFLMHCCAWQHTALSLLILLNEHSAVVDRSPFAAAVPAFSPLLCLLFCVVLTVLGRLSLTPLGRPLPMMMCITNAPFQEIPAARLSKTHEIMKIADLIVLRTPPSLCTSPTGYLLYGSHA